MLPLERKLSNDDKVFPPGLLVSEGKVGTIEVVNPEGTVHYKIEFNAGTQVARTVAATSRMARSEGKNLWIRCVKSRDFRRS